MPDAASGDQHATPAPTSRLARLRGRPRPLLLVAAAVAVAVALGAGLALGLSSDGHKGLTRRQYLTRASAICQTYGRKLDQIPPPVDIASIGNVLASVTSALPIVKEQEVRIRALDPPPELREQVARFFALTDRSIAALEEVRRAAKNTTVAGIGIGLQHFGTVSNEAKIIATRIGYRC